MKEIGRKRGHWCQCGKHTKPELREHDRRIDAIIAQIVKEKDFLARMNGTTTVMTGVG